MADTEKSTRVKKPAVYALTRPSRCYNCDRKLVADEIVQLRSTEDEREVLCRQCAGLGNLEVLLSGNARLTKLAAKYSAVHFTIMKWSDLWKCYERKGILVESQAIDKAEAETGIKLSGRQRVDPTA